MFLVSVKAKNFQGYRNLEIDLEGGPACIVGANMSGKSSAGRAILWCCTGSFPYPKDMGRITKEMVHPDEWSELSSSKKKGLATIVETVFYIISENENKEDSKKYYCITRTQALSKSSSSLVLQEFDPETGAVAYKFTGAEAQKIIYSLAKITGDTAKENAKMFFRTHWLGVGQETSFFYASGSQRREILETINPQTTLVKMHKEASSRLKTKKTLESSTEKDFAIVNGSLENYLADLSSKLTRISGLANGLDKIEASLSNCGFVEKAAVLSRVREELAERTAISKVNIDKYLETKNSQEEESIDDQLKLISSLDFDNESRGFADLQQKFSTYLLKAGQIRKEFSIAGLEYSKVDSLKNEIKSLHSEIEEWKKSAESSGSSKDLEELLTNLTETAENIRLLQEIDNKTQKLINIVNTLKYKQKELNDHASEKKNQIGAVDDILKFFTENESEYDIIESCIESFEKTKNETELLDYSFHQKLATNLKAYFSKYSQKEFTEALSQVDDIKSTHSSFLSSLINQCSSAKEEIGKASNQYLNITSKQTELSNRLNEYNDARTNCISSRNSVAKSWLNLKSNSKYPFLDSYLKELRSLSLTAGKMLPSDPLDRLIEKASNISEKTVIQENQTAAYSSAVVAKFQKIAGFIDDLDGITLHDFYHQCESFKEVLGNNKSIINAISSEIEELKTKTTAQQFKINHVTEKLSKQNSQLNVEVCEECGQDIDEKHRSSHKEKLKKEELKYSDEYSKSRLQLDALESKRSLLEQDLGVKSDACMNVIAMVLSYFAKIESLLDETISDLNSSETFNRLEKEKILLETTKKQLYEQSIAQEAKLSEIRNSLSKLTDTKFDSQITTAHDGIATEDDHTGQDKIDKGVLLNSRLSKEANALADFLSKLSLDNAKKDGIMAARQNAAKEDAKSLALDLGLLAVSFKSKNRQHFSMELSKLSESFQDELNKVSLSVGKIIEETNSHNELLAANKRLEEDTKEKVLASPLFEGVSKEESFGPEILPAVLSQVSEVRQILEKVKTSQAQINNNETMIRSKQTQIASILDSKSKLHIAMIEKFSQKTIENTLMETETRINHISSEMSLLEEMFSKITQRLYAVKATGRALVTIIQERKSLENNCRILAPNGEARTLAITDDISFIANQTNIQLKNLMLEKALGVSLSLAKDEDDDTPVINIQFEVDGKSGRTLPSESQRKIVGFAMDIAVMLLGVKDGFLIVDEPETGMDDKNSGKISQFLKAISSQTILITNRAAAGLGQIIKTTDLHQSKDPSFKYTDTAEDDLPEESAPVKNKTRRKAATKSEEKPGTIPDNTTLPDEGTL